jgi:hypothetical protein
MPATINRAMQFFTEKRKPEFVEWVPSGFKVGINSPPMRTPMSWPMRDMSRSITCLIPSCLKNSNNYYITIVLLLKCLVMVFGQLLEVNFKKHKSSPVSLCHVK